MGLKKLILAITAILLIPVFYAASGPYDMRLCEPGRTAVFDRNVAVCSQDGMRWEILYICPEGQVPEWKEDKWVCVEPQDTTIFGLIIIAGGLALFVAVLIIFIKSWTDYFIKKNKEK